MISDNNGQTLYYGYTDNQGSLVALTDQNGNVVEKYAYDPWGARRNPTDWRLKDTRPGFITNRGYTGHEHIDAFGIINMNGRVYDPSTGMFFSPDPYIQSPGDWLNYNRYSYCFGNPLRYSDPTGLLTWNDIISGISIVAGIFLLPVPYVGEALIVAGVTHFVGTTVNYINSNHNGNPTTWDKASNDFGFNFSTTIDINGPTQKEKNYSKNPNYSENNGNYENNSKGVDASNSDHDINLLSDQLNHYSDKQNALDITFGKMLDDQFCGGAQLSLVFTGDEDMSNSHWQQTVTTDWPLGYQKFKFTSKQNGRFTTYPDNSHSGPNSLDYYSHSEMSKNIIGGYTVLFNDTPRRPLLIQASVYWYASLSLINNDRPVFTINYGFRLDFNRIHLIYFNFYFYPKY